jgi:glutathione peroxidase
MQKVDVNGGGASPVYKFLKDNAKVGSIPWNFSKFLVNADGHVVAYYPPQS